MSERRIDFIMDSSVHSVHVGEEGGLHFLELSRRRPPGAQALTLAAKSPEQLQSIVAELIGDLEMVQRYLAHLGEEDED